MVEWTKDPLSVAIVGSLVAAGTWLGLELVMMPVGNQLRLQLITDARAYAASVGKPVLNVGCCGIGVGGIPQDDPRVRSAGDVNVDLRHEGVSFIDGTVHMQGSIYELPFSDRQFGAVIAAHILEHLDDPDRALAELNRVADRAFILVPDWWLPSAWLFPDHRWVYFQGKVGGPRLRIRP